jgi:uncharacterized membrane protein
MSAVHLHLLVNHLPVVGVLVAAAVLAYALLRKSDELVRFGFGMLVVLGAVGGGVYFTGEPAEERVEGRAGISEAMIERHEEAAQVATVLLGAAAAAALVALLALRRNPARSALRLARPILILTLAPALAMAYTAYLGGQVGHAELRSELPPADLGDVEPIVTAREPSATPATPP